MKDLKKMLDRPIAFHRPFVAITGSVNAALMLSQAFYWANRTDDVDGWFYKTQAEWEAETGLSRREQDGARAKLRSTGILQEKIVGIPARLFYRVDTDALLGAMHQTAKQDAPDPHNDAPNRQTVCTKPPSSEHESANLLTRDYAETTQRPQRGGEKTVVDLCKYAGIFDPHEMSAMPAIVTAYMNIHKKNLNDTVEHMVGRWLQYQEGMKKREWNYGSAYRFFVSGLWDKPDLWPTQKPAKADPMSKMKFTNA